MGAGILLLGGWIAAAETTSRADVPLWPVRVFAAMFIIGGAMFAASRWLLPRARRELPPESGHAALVKPEPPPFEVELYTGKMPDSGDWITRHYVRIKNPPGHPECWVRVSLIDIEPEPRHRSPYSPRPAYPYHLPTKGGADGTGGAIVQAGREESWFVGDTATGDDGKMHLFEFNVTRGAHLSWQLDPDEDLRFTYVITCLAGAAGERAFTIRVYSEDGETILVRREGS